MSGSLFGVPVDAESSLCTRITRSYSGERRLGGRGTHQQPRRPRMRTNHGSGSHRVRHALRRKGKGPAPSLESVTKAKMAATYEKHESPRRKGQRIMKNKTPDIDYARGATCTRRIRRETSVRHTTPSHSAGTQPMTRACTATAHHTLTQSRTTYPV